MNSGDVYKFWINWNFFHPLIGNAIPINHNINWDFNLIVIVPPPEVVEENPTDDPDWWKQP